MPSFSSTSALGQKNIQVPERQVLSVPNVSLDDVLTDTGEVDRAKLNDLRNTFKKPVVNRDAVEILLNLKRRSIIKEIEGIKFEFQSLKDSDNLEANTMTLTAIKNKGVTTDSAVYGLIFGTYFRAARLACALKSIDGVPVDLALQTNGPLERMGILLDMQSDMIAALFEAFVEMFPSKEEQIQAVEDVKKS